MFFLFCPIFIFNVTFPPSQTDLSGRARLSYDEATVVSKLVIPVEYYTHDVMCTFYARGDGITAYSGVSRIIVYSKSIIAVTLVFTINMSFINDLKEIPPYQL